MMTEPKNHAAAVLCFIEAWSRFVRAGSLGGGYYTSPHEVAAQVEERKRYVHPCVSTESALGVVEDILEYTIEALELPRSWRVEVWEQDGEIRAELKETRTKCHYRGTCQTQETGVVKSACQIRGQ